MEAYKDVESCLVMDFERGSKKKKDRTQRLSDLGILSSIVIHGAQVMYTTVEYMKQEEHLGEEGIAGNLKIVL